ncbi:MAG TPA: S41 family peptidase [Polyangiaceae bacterium]|nr:S41 family peptidase [Polyangiaceae bacterium]
MSHLAEAGTERENPYRVVEQLGRVLVWIENEYVDPVDRKRLVEGSIKGMVAELDPHSSYMPAEDYAIFQGDTEGHFGGVGVEVDFGDEYVTVIAPIEGSPAEKAGIKSGDHILAIDNVSVRGRPSVELVRQMRGEPGSHVLMTIRRPGLDKILYLTLTRQIITVASVSSKLLKGGIGYLRVKTFQTGTHAEFLDHFAKLRKENGTDLSGVILDMRNNPGGLVNEASAIADEFLPGGVIYTTRRRGKIVDEVRADSGGAVRRGPLVLLVNEFSASAAELVAGAIQDNHRATLVGAKTFGKGSVQTIIDLPDGAGLRLTTLRYYTPSGRAIQEQGVTPDVLVSGATPAEAFGVVREENLDNHLPPVEGASPKVVAPKVVVPPGAAEETPDAGSETDLGVARTVPLDPRGGPDTALSIAYQIVTGTLTRSAANAEAASATAAALSAKPAATTLPPAAPSATSKATPKK